MVPVEKKKKEPSGKKKKSGRSPGVPDQNQRSFNFERVWVDEQLEKFDQLLNVTDSYRGPLTYFLSALFLKVFNNTYQFAYLSNQIFNIICIVSIFQLSKLLKNESTGIWAALIFTFSSIILNHRFDYLIDLSLSSFSTLCFLFFTKWFLDEKNPDFANRSPENKKKLVMYYSAATTSHPSHISFPSSLFCVLSL